MDEDRFFREAATRLCSSLRLEKGLWKCLLIVRDHLPADTLSLHLFDPGFGVIETVADATLAAGVALSVRTQLPPPIRERVRTHIFGLKGEPVVQIIDRLNDDEMARLVARDMGAPDDPCLLLDLLLEGEYLGIMSVTNSGKEKYREEDARLFRLLHDPMAIASANFLRQRELKELKDLIAEDYGHLQDDMMRLKGEVVGAEFGLKRVMELVRQVAPTESPVLLLGETGVGKEVIANAIHRISSRRDRPFIKVDCAAIPDGLLNSELFGHERGAFTGAISQIRGRFERAHSGTIFLDEIGDLPLEAQKKILRVLQDKVIERVGGAGPIKVDIRIIAATHRDLKTMMKEGGFREDLFFRLNVFPLIIPPLRERKADIPGLVRHFIKKKTGEMGLPGVPELAPGAIDFLMDYGWPGNIRELENRVERALILNRGNLLIFSSPEDYRSINRDQMTKDPETRSLNLDLFISSHISRVLERTNGRVEGEKGAARLLGVHPRTLQHRMKKLGIPFGRKFKKKA